MDYRSFRGLRRRKGGGGRGTRGIDFDREIRPILSDRCFRCHGPDENERQAELRLDTARRCSGPPTRGPAVVPGKPAESELIRRIKSSRKGFLMPPPESGKSLSAAEKDRSNAGSRKGRRTVALVARAAFAGERPRGRDRSWPRNPIDRFILARLEAEGLRPSPEADRRDPDPSRCRST